MKRKGSNIGYLNHKGMSLVEVLIAMTILTLVTVPILHIFVSTARYNAKARERQHMTLSAESIMESFKAYDIEELCRQFQTTPTTFTGCKLYAGDGLTPPGTLEVTGTDVTGAATSNLFTPAGEFLGSADDTYEFRIHSLVNEKDRYDAVITVEPYTGWGTSSVVEIDDMNLYKDAIWRSTTDHDATAQGQIIDHFHGSVAPQIVTWLNDHDKQKNDYTQADILPDKIEIVKRETLIDIVKGSDMTAQVRMEYHYRIKDYPYYDNAADPTSTAKMDFPTGGGDYTVHVIVDSPAGTYIEFYRNPAAAGLERVFVYYYPLYGTGVEDVIRFTTSGFSASDKLECYLLKQVNTGVVNLPGKEAAYQPKVLGDSKLILYHNLDENISGSSSVPTVNLSTFASHKSYMHADLLKENKVIMYRVLVDIYEAGGTQIVASLEGTMNN